MLFNQNEILKYHQTKNDIKNKKGKKLPMMSDFLKNMEKKNAVAKGNNLMNEFDPTEVIVKRDDLNESTSKIYDAKIVFRDNYM